MKANPRAVDYDSCPDKYKSYYIAQEQNKENPTMSQKSFQRLVTLTEWDMNSELRNASKSKTLLSGQPKTYLQVEGVDILRDDGLIYEEVLKEAGVPTKIDLYPGCVHGTMFHMMGTELGNSIIIDAIVGLGWLLDKTVSREDAADAAGIKLNEIVN
jgi:acetyl esterase/lipase